VLCCEDNTEITELKFTKSTVNTNKRTAKPTKAH